MSLPVQIKLLNILQERLFNPVGSHLAQQFQGRVIAATNQDHQELRRKGLFRDDFYYRLCSDSIFVPPLRQRLKEDPEEMHRLQSDYHRKRDLFLGYLDQAGLSYTMPQGGILCND